MNTDNRIAGDNGIYRANSAHGSALKLLLSLIVLATAGCSDMVPPAANVTVLPQPDLSALSPEFQTAAANVSQAATGSPTEVVAADTHKTVLDHVAVSSADKTRVLFLHGLHSPLGMALAMSRMPTPR